MSIKVDGTNGVVLTPKITGNASALSYGRTSKSVAGGANVSLLAADYQNRVIELTGAITANIEVIFPLTDGAEWVVYNGTSGAFTVTVIGATGTGVVVAQGKRAIVYCDGTNIQRATADV